MKTQLSEQEVHALQEKIVLEGWLPTYEGFSLHIYEARYEVDGELYTFYSALGKDELPIVERSER